MSWSYGCGGWPCGCTSPILLVVLSHARYSQAEPIQTAFTATGTAVNGSWTASYSNVNVSDNTYATDTWDSGTGLSGDILDLTNFGFSIPTGATIDGITVKIERKASASGNLKDLTVQMIQGGSPTGTNKASATTYGTSDATATYGSSSDLWGLTISPADINASTFGVRFQPQASSNIGSVTVSVDLVTIQVRYTHSGHATVTAFDGTTTSSAGPGAPLWDWDAGTTPTSVDWTMGKVVIDADGNSYIVYGGRSVTGPPNYSTGKLTKLDINGSHQWTVTSGDGADITVTDKYARPPAVAIDPTDGSILFSHPTTNTGNYFLTRVDSSGSVVAQYAYPGGSIPASRRVTSARALGIDSSGNILLSAGNGTDVDSTAIDRLMKLDSSGNWVAEYAPGTTFQVNAISIDATNDKAYIGTIGPTLTTSPFIVKVDIAAMTADWTKTYNDIESGGSLGSSNNIIITNGLDSSLATLISGLGRLVTGGGTLLDNWCTLDSSGSTLTKNKLSAAGSVSGFTTYSHGVYDPITDSMFVYANVPVNTDLRLYKLGGGIGSTWGAFSAGITGGGLTYGGGLAARTV